MSTLLTTELCLSDQERNYLENELQLDQEEIEAIEDSEYTEFTDITRLVKALFACQKNEDAWDNIRANKEIIDFTDLFTKCPFIQMDRLATDIYKYLHDNNIIDDASYRYFEVLSGKLNDWDFWKTLFDGKSTTEMLDIIYDSYNNVFTTQNINPYELGLVSLEKDQLDYIFGDLKEGVKVDAIFNERPCINIEPEIMRALIFNDNLQRELAGKYFGILFNIYNAMGIEIGEPDDDEFFTAFFRSIIQYSVKYNVSPTDIIIDMNINEIDKFVKIIKHLKTVNSETDIAYSFDILEVITNNALMLIYSNTILDIVLGEEDTHTVSANHYLKPINYAMIVSFALNPRIDTSEFIIKYPFPGKFPAVYNKAKNILFMNGKVFENYDFNLDSERLFGFIDDYEVSETIDNNLFALVNDIDAYKEFIHVMKNFKSECEKSQ